MMSTAAVGFCLGPLAVESGQSDFLRKRTPMSDDFDFKKKDDAAFAMGDEPYTLGPDSLPQPGVPAGIVTKHHHTSQTIYPGVQRDYWVYVPQQYDADHPACLMVFQDAQFYLGNDVHAATVFDNLIHRGEMPVTIGVFVSPGDKGPGNPIYGGEDNRSLEYDSLGDQYARYLLEELLPEVEAEYNITSDPEGRATCRHEFRRYLCLHDCLGTP